MASLVMCGCGGIISIISLFSGSGKCGFMESSSKTARNVRLQPCARVTGPTNRSLRVRGR